MPCGGLTFALAGFELVYSIPFADGRMKTYLREMATPDGAIRCLGGEDRGPEGFDAPTACRSMCVGQGCADEARSLVSSSSSGQVKEWLGFSLVSGLQESSAEQSSSA